MSGTRTYRAWLAMMSRCDSGPEWPGYQDYAGRGIVVADRWRTFENFFADMGECPDGYELDRENTNGNFEPGNCRWATDTTNARNRRITPMYTFNGKTQSLGGWADESGVPYGLLKSRVAGEGWDIGRAITTPKIIGRPRKNAADEYDTE